MIHQKCTRISYSIHVTLCTLLLVTLDSVVCNIYCTPEKHEYYFRQLNKCRSCDKCILGEGTDEDSKVTFDKKFGALTCKSCKPCDKGYFSKKRAYRCKPCRDCAIKGRYTRLPCTRFTNTVCGDRIKQIELTSKLSPVFEVANTTSRIPCEKCDKDGQEITKNIGIHFESNPLPLTAVIAAAIGTPMIVLTVVVVVIKVSGKRHINEKEEIRKRSNVCPSKRDSTSTDCAEELNPLSMGPSFSSFSGLSDEIQGAQRHTASVYSPSSDATQIDLNSPLKYSFPSLQSPDTNITVTSLSSNEEFETSYHPDSNGNKLKPNTTNDNAYSDDVGDVETRESGVERRATIIPNLPNGEYQVIFSSGKQQYPSTNTCAGHQDESLLLKPLLESRQCSGLVYPQVNAAMEEDADMPTIIAGEEEKLLNNRSKDNKKHQESLKQTINRFSRSVAPKGTFYHLCRELGVSNTDLDIIAVDYQGDVKEQAYRSLLKWTEQNPGASIHHLEKALLNIDCGHLLNNLKL